ncbi:MAG: hypothetical protein JW763_00590 [candidate division Zixibacteria bacterium]|nr:hypothetical protein [candidate division Zixibacteria bacterium]
MSGYNKGIVSHLPSDIKPGDFRLLENQILEYAHTGVPRTPFLQKTALMLLSFSSCDAVRLILLERGQRFCCLASSNAVIPFRHEISLAPTGHPGNPIWSEPNNDELEQFCRNIVKREVDFSKPYFTRNGSFWSGDITRLDIPAMKASENGDSLCMSIDGSVHTMALVPILAAKDRIGLLALQSEHKQFLSEAQIESYEHLAHTLGIAFMHRRLHVALRERVKELTCLYGIAKLVANPEITLEELLQKTVELLPPAWLYPDIASAQIVVDRRPYRTANYHKGVQNLRSDIFIDGKRRGFVEIGYREIRPQLDDGPFLIEERNLIDTISREIAVIIEQTQVEHEKQQLQDQLRHADRLATIGQLAASVTHELNEPLVNILGFAQLAVKEPNMSEQAQQDITKIINAALHAREVIKKLLIFARDTTAAKTLMNLNDLVEDGLFFLESRCNKSGIELVRNLAENMPDIIADHSQLLQVLTNLVVNSIHAMPEGGTLTLHTAFNEREAVLIVEDSGTGMTKEVMKKIFSPFFTTKDLDQGTGLGLSVVMGIINSHSGKIDVASKVGSGTKVTIRLPLETAEDTEEYGNG